MTRALGTGILGLVLASLAIVIVVWAWPFASTARGLYLFEQESPTEVVSGSAAQGVGLLGLDVVQLDGGRSVEVVRQGQPRAQWPQPDFLVGTHGARLADEPPHEGAWVPFAIRAVLGLVTAVALLALAVPTSLGALRRMEVVYGQRDPEARVITQIPGAGTHGGAGGQVPPFVPHNPDWEPKRRIR